MLCKKKKKTKTATKQTSNNSPYSLLTPFLNSGIFTQCFNVKPSNYYNIAIYIWIILKFH